ncbi:MAG: HAD-IC family P-type ATPase [Chloroflexota bacterium]
MTILTEAPRRTIAAVRLKSRSGPGRIRLELDGLRGCQHTASYVAEKLQELTHVREATANALTGTVLVTFDPRHWDVDQVLQHASKVLGVRPPSAAAKRASGGNGPPTPGPIRSVPRPGRARLTVPGLRRSPERERAVEAHFRSIDGVQSARASAWTGNVLVSFDPSRCSVDDIVAASQTLGHVEAQRRHWLDRAAPEAPATEEPQETWHAMEAPLIARRLEVDPNRGLTAAEILARRSLHGSNTMPEGAEPSLAALLWEQVANAPTVLLIAGAGISLATGGLIEAVLIGAVIVINGAVGAATERTGHRAIAALQASTPIRVRVRRDGADQFADSDDLVPGDVIQLLPGDPVPADARIIDVSRFMVEESALTGESRPIEKTVAAVSASMPLADRNSMVHRGTTVVGGRGLGLVVATGPRTAIGQLQLLASESESPPTPMERDLDRMGRWLAGGAAAICGVVFGLGLLRGVPFLHSAEVAVSLGVAAIPEGLTALATSVLALASGRMRKKGTLIRTLGAAEALGSVTVVCADKTGTLTENRMAATEMYVGGRVIRLTGAAYSPVARFEIDGETISPLKDRALESSLIVGTLCSDADIQRDGQGDLVIDGSATEGAIQIAAIKAGVDTTSLRDRHPRLDLRDRSDGRRHMVTVHRVGDRLMALMKGSPEEVLALSDTALYPDGERPLDESLQAEIGQRNADMSGRAMRVLGMAERELPENYDPDELGRGYRFLGLIGLVDPVRPAVPAAIRALHTAGIRTVMITGDQALTATAVARELGLSRRGSLRVLEAGDLSSMNPESLRGLVRDVGIFARVPPEMKLQVVRALQDNGEVVAMTGDGVNDGPALRAADVGVAMGERGTELARELADVVLSTDDFTQMVDAVEEGRLVRANVRRVLHYMLSTNASEIWVVAGAVAFGFPSPLTPLQLLWLNVVTDLAPGLGLAVEPREPNVMQQPPRDPKEPIIPVPLMKRMLLESGAIAAGALTTYGIGVARYGIGPVAQTMAFASLVGAQLLHVPLSRAGDGPATLGGRPKNNMLWIGVGISAALQGLALFFPPLRFALGSAPLALFDLGVCALGAFLPIAAIETERRTRYQLTSGRQTTEKEDK